MFFNFEIDVQDHRVTPIERPLRKLSIGVTAAIGGDWRRMAVIGGDWRRMAAIGGEWRRLAAKVAVT